MSDQHGKTLPVHHVDQIAKLDPSRLLFLVPKGKDPRDGFHEITYKHFSRAVDYLAWYLEERVGKKDSFSTLGFVGHPGDFRYSVITFAVIKIGWVAFFTSPRNSAEAQLSLLEQSNCNLWLVDEVTNPIVARMVENRPLELVNIPSEQFFLSTNFGDEAPPYIYNKNFEDGRMDPFAVMHTSGSTGIPKVIYLRQSWLTAQDALKNRPDSNIHSKNFDGLKVFVTLPWYHTAAYTLSIASNMYYNATTIIAPATPLTAETIDAYHQFAGVDVTIAAPSMLKALASNQIYAENCARLKYIANGGGPSTTEVGQILTKYTHPINVGGTTEGSLWPSLLLDPEDFMYWSFDPSWGADFRPINDEQYQLWIVRDPNLKDYQAIFETFPELQEWNSEDLFLKHPTKPNLWKLVGRSDDVIMLGSGLKVNSEMIETEFTNHPHFNGVVAFGEGQSELGIVIEVDPENMSSVRSELVPILEKYNSGFAAHGRIAEDMVVFSAPDKPFPRTAKGTIQKQMCRTLYEQEIADAYQRLNKPDTVDGVELEKDSEKLKVYLSEWIATKTAHPAPAPDQDFFEAASGIDSLLVARLARMLTSALPGVQVTVQTIYNNPTIAELADFITGHDSNQHFHQLNRAQQMSTLFDEYTQSLPLNSRPASSQDGPLTIVVTGTTGSLGSYILNTLLRRQDIQVDKVYCLNRSSKSEEVQKEVNSTRGLTTHFESRVKFIEMDLHKPRLGLALSVYKELLHNVDIVIHNAWTVDFNESLESFKPQIGGVRQFVDLCSQSRKGASLHFMSTIGTVENWRGNGVGSRDNAIGSASTHAVANTIVPEKPLSDWSVSAGMGYSESKQISEVLLTTACTESDVPVTVYRVGQIAGPIQRSRQGAWLKRQWVPTLIQTSITLRTFPKDLGTMSEIDWIPVDIISEIVIDLAVRKTEASDPDKAGTPQYYHLVNPHGTTWSSLLPTILEKLPPSESDPEIVPLHDWIEKVRTAGNDAGPDVLPALKILPFYEALSEPHKDAAGDGAVLKLDTSKARARSTTLQSLEAVKPQWMELWMEQWAF